MLVREYVVVGSGALQLAAAPFESRLERWRADWGVPEAGFEISARGLSAGELGGGTGWCEVGGGRALRLEPGFADAVRAAVVPDAQEGSIAISVARSAWKAFLVEVLEVHDDLLPGDPPVQLARAGMGTIAVEIVVRGCVVQALLPHVARKGMRKEAGTSPGKVSSGSVDGLRLTLRAQLASVELSVEALRRLAVGDVVHLGKPLDHAAEVLGPGGEALFHGHLCAYEGRRALDLISLTNGGQP